MTTFYCDIYLPLWQHLSMTPTCHYDNIFLWHLPAIMTTSVCDTYLPLWHMSVNLPVFKTSVCDTYLSLWQHLSVILPAMMTHPSVTPTCHDDDICLWHIPAIMTTSASLRASPLFCRACIGLYLPRSPRAIPPRKQGIPMSCQSPHQIITTNPQLIHTNEPKIFMTNWNIFN